MDIAIDLTRSLVAEDRYQRLLEAVRSCISCDATALMMRQGRQLVPLAVRGLAPEVLGMRFDLAEHPRLDAIVNSPGPLRFAAECALPDPFDGLVEGTGAALDPVHDCLGCPLEVDGDVIGVLTADALTIGAFDGLEPDYLLALGALAGAALHTTRLVDTIAGLAERRGLVVRELTRDRLDRDDVHLLGVSRAIEQVRQELDTVATTDLPVLILGETGVGKEVAARAIHAASARSDAPLIHVNCAALPAAVVESELFGHVRGAFTGATADRAGKFTVADGGTLFLDEIGELPLSVQPTLLRALQEGEVQRVGADRMARVDVRVIAATNRDLEREVADGRFRSDLYHRLNAYPVRISPLRERPDDVGILAGMFLDRHRARLGVGSVVLSPDARLALERSTWPGNARELDHVLARAVLRVAARSQRVDAIRVEAGDLDVAPAIATPAGDEATLVADLDRGELTMRAAVDQFKRSLVLRALERSGGSWAAAARHLGMHRSNLHHLAARLGIRD